MLLYRIGLHSPLGAAICSDTGKKGIYTSDTLHLPLAMLSEYNNKFHNIDITNYNLYIYSCVVDQICFTKGKYYDLNKFRNSDLVFTALDLERNSNSHKDKILPLLYDTNGADLYNGIEYNEYFIGINDIQHLTLLETRKIHFTIQQINNKILSNASNTCLLQGTNFYSTDI